MTEEKPGDRLMARPTTWQRLYVRSMSHTLIDLTILNLFDEHWRYVTVDSFTVSILAAVLLKVLLKVTLALEYRFAECVKTKFGSMANPARLCGTWLILFGSKFVGLEAVNLIFGDPVRFTGPLHGVVAFIVVVVVMLMAERAISLIYLRLADSSAYESGD